MLTERDELILKQVAFKGAIEYMGYLLNGKNVTWTEKFDQEDMVEQIRKYTEAFYRILKEVK